MWWIRSDICGLFSAGFTVILLLYAQYVMVTVVILPWYGFSYHVPLYTTLTILALIAHCRAQFTNPGAIPLERVPPAIQPTIINAHGQEVLAPPPRVCRRCKVLKPYKAHHCSTCGRCIIRMDHHCPWVNNCVAIFNQKYFLLFLVYTALCCIYSGTLLVARFISCTNNLKQCTISGLSAVLCVLNFIEAIIFGLFCIIMLWDQLSAIFENTPGIDALQNKKGESRGKYESLLEVFGEPFGWRWWLPLNLPMKIDHAFVLECDEMEDPNVTEQEEEQRARFYEQQVAIQQAQAQARAKKHAAQAQGQAGKNGNGHDSAESIADAHARYMHPLGHSSSHASSGGGAGPIVFPDSLLEPDVDRSAELDSSMEGDHHAEEEEEEFEQQLEKHATSILAGQHVTRSPTLTARPNAGKVQK